MFTVHLIIPFFYMLDNQNDKTPQSKMTGFTSYTQFVHILKSGSRQLFSIPVRLWSTNQRMQLYIWILKLN